MSRPLLSLLLVALFALVATGCGGGEGGDGIAIARDDPQHEGAQIFNQRCGACHTMEAAGTHGSSTSIGSIEYKDGPNFNDRYSNYEDVVYAIQNGGFSGQQMPQNLVTGRQAELVACFVSTYSGQDVAGSTDPGAQTGSDNADCASRLGLDG